MCRGNFTILIVIRCLNYFLAGRVFVHEWAHLRWGVFNEYNNDQKFYLSNGKNKAVRYGCFDNFSQTILKHNQLFLDHFINVSLLSYSLSFIVPPVSDFHKTTTFVQFASISNSWILYSAATNRLPLCVYDYKKNSQVLCSVTPSFYIRISDINKANGGSSVPWGQIDICVDFVRMHGLGGIVELTWKTIQILKQKTSPNLN